MSDKALENALRRKATRLGMRVVKSRARNLHANDHGGFQMIDDRNIVVRGERYDLDIHGLADALEIEVNTATA